MGKLLIFLYGSNVLPLNLSVMFGIFIVVLSQIIDFKILMLVYKALNGLGPKYLSSFFPRLPRVKTKQRSSVHFLCTIYVEQTTRKLFF